MISELGIARSHNLPAEINGALDEPWQFAGEVKGRRPWVDVFCEHCNRMEIPLGRPTPPKMLTIVTLKGYRFITDDLMEVIVYFGRCDECNRCFWARSGPPFTHARYQPVHA